MRTDYSRIADSYDKNPIRHRIDREAAISRLIEERGGGFRLLDLACGTGNFLVAQSGYFAEEAVRWFGLDLSEAMLEKAREKLPGIDLAHGSAEDMPYDDSYFDLVVCGFAFHHFEHKAKALGEIARVLRPGGSFIMRNLCHEYMERSWVYRYFPETEEIDRSRFWSPRRIYDALLDLGFSVKISVECTLKEYVVADLLEEAENRDMSQLHMISEESYQQGLRRLRVDRDSEPTFHGDFALLYCEAVSPSHRAP